jgi:hypothetical protein
LVAVERDGNQKHLKPSATDHITPLVIISRVNLPGKEKGIRRFKESLSQGFDRYGQKGGNFLGKILGLCFKKMDIFNLFEIPSIVGKKMRNSVI